MLAVSDDGVGLPPTVRLRALESLAMQLIQTLAAQVGGEFSFASGASGSRFQLAFRRAA